jgi:hypothetical protein
MNPRIPDVKDFTSNCSGKWSSIATLSLNPQVIVESFMDGSHPLLDLVAFVMAAFAVGRL